MKSSIKIDLGPAIEVRLIYSDDVRDKLLKKFFEQLGHASNLAYVHFKGTDKDGQEITIFPVGHGEVTDHCFKEEAYFDRGEICPAQCARLIPLCFNQLDSVQSKEIAEKIFDITVNDKAIETLHHVEGIYYAFCSTKGQEGITMNCDGQSIWFSSPTYQGGTGLHTKELLREDLNKLGSVDLAILILDELNKLVQATVKK